MLTRRTHTCGELRAAHEGATVVVQGWAHAVRDRGGVTFLVLRDRHGIVQVTADDRCPEAARLTAKDVRLEYVVQVRGTVALRAESAQKADQPTGRIEVLPDEVQILSRTRPLPFAISSKAEAGEDVRLSYRYLDLRRPELQNNLIVRHQTMLAARKVLDDLGFLEVETPMMNMIAGGATAKPFETYHNSLEMKVRQLLAPNAPQRGHHSHFPCACSCSCVSRLSCT